MEKGKVLSLEDRIPKIREYRRRKANKRLIFLLSVFFFLIALVVYFQSPLSHINSIKINGHRILSEDNIIVASKIQRNENVWRINKNKAKKGILALPEVKEATIKFVFPNNLVVDIKEYKPIALIQAESSLKIILENGTVVDENEAVIVNAPILYGFEEGDVLNDISAQLSKMPIEILGAISEIRYVPKETDKFRISMYMNDGFEVNATIPTLSSKMSHYPSITSQLNPNVKGVIDLEVGSFFKAYETKEEVISEGEEEEG